MKALDTSARNRLDDPRGLRSTFLCSWQPFWSSPLLASLPNQFRTTSQLAFCFSLRFTCPTLRIGYPYRPKAGWTSHLNGCSSTQRPAGGRPCLRAIVQLLPHLQVLACPSTTVCFPLHAVGGRVTASVWSASVGLWTWICMRLGARK